MEIDLTSKLLRYVPWCTTELWDALKSFILTSLKFKVAPYPIIVSLDTLKKINRLASVHLLTKKKKSMTWPLDPHTVGLRPPRYQLHATGCRWLLQTDFSLRSRSSRQTFVTVVFSNRYFSMFSGLCPMIETFCQACEWHAWQPIGMCLERRKARQEMAEKSGINGFNSNPPTANNTEDVPLVSSDVIDPFECVDGTLTWWQFTKVSVLAVKIVKNVFLWVNHLRNLFQYVVHMLGDAMYTQHAP